MSDGRERLRTLLGVEPPAGVLALQDADLDALADVLAESRRAQARSLHQAFDSTLKHVPLPVRAIVKRVLRA